MFNGPFAELAGVEFPLPWTGCAHAQQLIWQLFNSIEKGFNVSGDTDTAFLEGGL